MSAERATGLDPDFAAARRAFRDLPVVHVGTLDPDGAPHVVPLWFVWLEEAIFVSSRSASRTVRNLRREPRIALSFHRGQAWVELAGVAVHGRADLLTASDPPVGRALSAWFEKYREHLAGSGFEAYATQVDEPVVIRVHSARLAGWAHSRVWGR